MYIEYCIKGYKAKRHQKKWTDFGKSTQAPMWLQIEDSG